MAKKSFLSFGSGSQPLRTRRVKRLRKPAKKSWGARQALGRSRGYSSGSGKWW